MEGKLSVIVGSMKSEKSGELIRQCKRHIYAKHKVLLFKPVVDNRFSEDEVVSRNGERLECINIKSIYDILNYITYDVDVVAIDELHLFSLTDDDEDVVEVINNLLDSDKDVLCAGLDMDYLAKPFSVVATLMAIAHKVDKMTAICTMCGNEAYVSHRLTKDNSRIVIGDEEYTPICRHCFKKLQKGLDK